MVSPPKIGTLVHKVMKGSLELVVGFSYIVKNTTKR